MSKRPISYNIRKDEQDRQDKYHFKNIKPVAPMLAPFNQILFYLIEQPGQYYCPAPFLSPARGGTYLRVLAEFFSFLFRQSDAYHPKHPVNARPEMISPG
jgi:hypothetical protein